MRKLLLSVLAKSPEGFQVFAANKAINYIFKHIAILHVEGKENLPAKNEPVIFICNHLSNLDGPALHRVLGEYDPTYVAGQKLSNDPFTGLFKRIYKSINIKPNSPDKTAMKEIIQRLRSGETVVIFPEGTRSRVGSMIEGKRGILLMAKLAKAKIVPLAMVGTDKVLPINKDGNMTTEKLHKGDIHITIGPAFHVPEKAEGESKEAYEDRAMNTIMRSIASMLPPAYQGVYGEGKGAV